MSHGRQSLGHHITAAFGKHFQLHSQKKDTVSMLISLLPDTGAALAVQQFLALRLAPQDSEMNQRYV